MISSAISIPLQPVHVARDQHPISRKDISPNALRVLYRLREGGYASYLVGGAVRDLLVGGNPKDYDVATDATPEQVKQLFRNCRLIGRRFRLAHVVYGREIIEVATFRANSDDGSGDRELEDGRLVRDNVYGTIEDDAVRRDFTANALYYTVEDFSVRDFVGGFEDVQNRVLRLIGDPETRYREDPVRMLRAVRLAAKLGFSIAPSAAEPIPRLAPLLDGAASARLFDECLKMFLTGHAERSFLGLEAHGLLPALFPQATQALARAGEATRAMVLAALENTDHRVAEERPVTPAFLLAALLWPAYSEEVEALLAQGLDPAVAQQRAADRVIVQQAQRVTLPRRFSLAMEEIWLLQARFGQRQRKRVFRLLAHPRFRAAYDFLELRAIQNPALLPEVAFWREAQIVPAEQLAEKLAPVRKGNKAAVQPDAPPVGDGATLASVKKRRRRRRPHPAGYPET